MRATEGKDGKYTEGRRGAEEAKARKGILVRLGYKDRRKEGKDEGRDGRQR